MPYIGSSFPCYDFNINEKYNFANEYPYQTAPPSNHRFKAALVGALPAVLAGDKPKRLKPAAELAALAGKVAGGSATDEDKSRLRQLAAKV
jgi:hypothetical protein